MRLFAGLFLLAVLASSEPVFCADSKLERVDPAQLLREIERGNWVTVEPLSQSELMRQHWRAQLSAFGPHHSGLDRFELLVELDSGLLKEARSRIKEAGKHMRALGGEAALLMELSSTDLFQPYRSSLLELARGTIREAQVTDKGNLVAESVETIQSEFSAAYMAEELVGDLESAKLLYARVATRAEKHVKRSRELGESDQINEVDSLRSSAGIRLDRLDRKLSVRQSGENRKGGQ